MNDDRVKEAPVRQDMSRDFGDGVVSFDPSSQARLHDALRSESFTDGRVSQIRLSACQRLGSDWLDAQKVIDELIEDHAILSEKLEALGRTTHRLTRQHRHVHSEPSEHSELSKGERLRVIAALEVSQREIWTVRDVLGALLMATGSRTIQPAFLPDAPCADYLRGLCAWTLAVMRAFEQLAGEVGQPNRDVDWASCRQQLDAARNFHFHELADAIGQELAWLETSGSDIESVTDLVQAFDDLLVEAFELEARLEERFGQANGRTG